jgi:tetratricopeptide (TPR) repeat protein
LTRICPNFSPLFLCSWRASVQETAQTRQPPKASFQPSTHARQHLEAGEYQKAIDDFRDEYRKGPHDQALIKEYAKTLEEIKMVADRASEKEDFVSAGKTYKVLLHNYPHFNGFTHRLSFDRPQVNTKLTECKTALSKKGFQEYRQGDLSEAISLWQGYLTIDPNNSDIKKALNTARMQQRNIHQMK